MQCRENARQSDEGAQVLGSKNDPTTASEVFSQPGRRHKKPLGRGVLRQAPRQNLINPESTPCIATAAGFKLPAEIGWGAIGQGANNFAIALRSPPDQQIGGCAERLLVGPSPKASGRRRRKGIGIPQPASCFVPHHDLAARGFPGQGRKRDGSAWSPYHPPPQSEQPPMSPPRVEPSLWER